MAASRGTRATIEYATNTEEPSIGGAAGPAGPAMAGPVLLTVPHPLLLTVPHPLISWVIINANVCFIFVDVPFSIL